MSSCGGASWESGPIKKIKVPERSKKSNASKSHWELKNAQGDSEVDRSRSGMHFSSIPMDVGAQFFRRNDIHTHTVWKDIDKEVIPGSASRSIRCQYSSWVQFPYYPEQNMFSLEKCLQQPSICMYIEGKEPSSSWVQFPYYPEQNMFSLEKCLQQPSLQSPTLLLSHQNVTSKPTPEQNMFSLAVLFIEKHTHR